MEHLRRRHPWLSEEDLAGLRRLILARAARQFEGAEMWRDAAECWAELGRHQQAAALYLRAGDVWQAAEAAFAGLAFAEALAHYRTWLEAQPADDLVAQIQGLLAQAACHLVPPEYELTIPDLTEASGRQLQQQARALIVRADTPLLAGRCWAALGAHGHQAWRFDLIEEGYERALEALAQAAALSERNQTARRYRQTVAAWGDHLLAADIERRLAEWQPDDARPGWWAQREIIESHPFRDNVRDVLHFTHEQQWAAWYVLAELEDAPDVDDYLRSLAPPDMVYIPPGVFLMGSADDDPEAENHEKPQHEVRLRGYYIDQYPVTNEQYRQFMEAGDYENRDYWTEAIEAGYWENGQFRDHRLYGGRERSQPQYWEDEHFQGERKPVVGVSWYEAVAYSRWAGKALPAEAQWEKAAGWDLETKSKRRYPWGDEFDAEKGNFGGRHDRTTEVGHYPEDQSAYGLMDVGGNVMEWCSTRWRNEDGHNYSYPYDWQDGREELDGGDSVGRVMKGSSWYQYSSESLQAKKAVRCGFRPGYVPGDWDYVGGFRCVLPHVCAPSEF